MEIDTSVVELVRTCLKEVWGVEEVTNDKVKEMIEMTLSVAVLHDMDCFDLPKTTEALKQYLKEKGIPIDNEEPETTASEEVESKESET